MDRSRPPHGYNRAVRPLENEFSWSISRARTFKDCPRKYWFHYYGSWGGWEPDADPEARELYQHLSEVLSGQGLEVMTGNRVIEVRPAGVSKARAAATILARRGGAPDLIAAFGDDVTDESLFRELPDDALTVLVGQRDTAARRRVDGPAAVRALLAEWRMRCAAHARACRIPTDPSGPSSSSARPAWARPRRRERSPSSCSTTRTRWCAST